MNILMNLTVSFCTGFPLTFLGNSTPPKEPCAFISLLMVFFFFFLFEFCSFWILTIRGLLFFALLLLAYTSVWRRRWQVRVKRVHAQGLIENSLTNIGVVRVPGEFICRLGQCVTSHSRTWMHFLDSTANKAHVSSRYISYSLVNVISKYLLQRSRYNKSQRTHVVWAANNKRATSGRDLPFFRVAAVKL